MRCHEIFPLSCFEGCVQGANHENGRFGCVVHTHFTEDRPRLEQQHRTWKNPWDYFLKRGRLRRIECGIRAGVVLAPLHVPALVQAHSCCFLLLSGAERCLVLGLPGELGALAAPTPSWLALPVFVIVVLARGQAWRGARLVGTVCTVSAEPSLSSYTINFFSNLVGVG